MARAVDNSLESKNLNGFFKIYRVSKSSDNEFDENASCKQEKKTFWSVELLISSIRGPKNKYWQRGTRKRLSYLTAYNP